MQNKIKLDDASYDLRFLLNRGYRKKNALNFVSNKYLLSQNERNYLARSIFSIIEIKSRSSKIMDVSEIENHFVLVDGYNVLITMETICRKDYDSLIWCDDGIIRDLNAVFGKYKFNEHTEKALKNILSLMDKYHPLKIKFFYDKQVSYSGELARLTNELMEFYGINGEAVLSNNVDFEIVQLACTKKGIVATSDSAIVDKVSRILDLPFYFLKITDKSVKRSF
ncbi:MAG: DUF434 domain-containing protein [Methanobacterium sp.]